MANMTRVLNEEQKNLLREAKAVLDTVVGTLNKSGVRFENGCTAVQSMGMPGLYVTYSACSENGMVATYNDTVITLIKYANNEWVLHTSCAMRFRVYTGSDTKRYANLIKSKSKFVRLTNIDPKYPNVKEIGISNCDWIR